MTFFAGGIKLIADTFPWSPHSCFAYTRDNHTSVLGARAVALQAGASAAVVDAHLSPHGLTPCWQILKHSRDAAISKRTRTHGSCWQSNCCHVQTKTHWMLWRNVNGHRGFTQQGRKLYIFCLMQAPGVWSLVPRPCVG